MSGYSAPAGGTVLADGGLRLVPPAAAQVPMLIELGSDPECLRWGDACPTGDETSARAYVRVAQERWSDLHAWSPRQWVIETSSVETSSVETSNEQGWRPAGVVEYRPDGHGGAEVGYAVHPDFRGQGLAAHALDLALAHGFENDGVRLARWRTEVGNWASRRVAWQLGFSAAQQVRGLIPGWGDDQGPRDGWISTLAHDEPRRPCHPWLEAVELVGMSIRLRPWRDADTSRIVEACTDGRSLQYLPDLPQPYQQPEARAYLAGKLRAAADGSGVGWCVADPGTDQALGSIGLSGLGPGSTSGELGYWTHPQARGHGVMTGAVRLLLQHALSSAQAGGLGLGRVWLRAARSNTASRRVATVAGMREVGRDREAETLRDGTVEDFVRYDMLASDIAGA